MKSANSAVIFDMDGVILDTEPLYTKAEIRLFGEYGGNILQIKMSGEIKKNKFKEQSSNNYAKIYIHKI